MCKNLLLVRPIEIMFVTTFSQGQSNLSNDDTAENNRQLIDELHDREWPRISEPGPMPGSVEKKQANRRTTEEAERRRGNHLPLPGKGCDQEIGRASCRERE